MKSLMMLVLAFALASPAAAVAGGDPARGESRFRLCAACHTADAATNRMGPHLKGVVGRPAGSVEGFNYSESMKAKGAEGLVWDEANLDEDRADVIAFLKTKM
jgi:cytochrome c